MKTILIKFGLFISVSLFSQNLNDFNTQQDTVNKIFNEILTLRKNLKKASVKYGLNLTKYNSCCSKVKLDIRLNKDCYDYAKFMAKSNYFEHSKLNCNESLAIMYQNQLFSVVYNFINEIANSDTDSDDGHRKHMIGHEDYHKDDTVFGIGLYKDGSVTYYCIRSANKYTIVPKDYNQSLLNK
ncbi:MAG: hypothetical protein EAZ53_07360 [Bacteroidetes bacterium]|nr:MAG: hypothetical protein EAZ53_07360 [Bacteroidota bacterium]